MIGKVGALPEGLPALAAAKRFLVYMNTQVIGQMGDLCKNFPTVAAGERLLLFARADAT